MASGFRHVAAVLVVAGCGAAGASGASGGAARPQPRASAGGRAASPDAGGPQKHDAAWVSRECKREYKQIEANWASYMPPGQATSPFAHCPRWRMAAPQACGARVQPSFFDPCHCMCDLCRSDADCGSDASCVSLSSVVCGGLPERVCVKKTDVCHPDNSARCPTYCIALFGHTECVKKADLAVCR